MHPSPLGIPARTAPQPVGRPGSVFCALATASREGRWSWALADEHGAVRSGVTANGCDGTAAVLDALGALLTTGGDTVTPADDTSAAQGGTAQGRTAVGRAPGVTYLLLSKDPSLLQALHELAACLPSLVPASVRSMVGGRHLISAAERAAEQALDEVGIGWPPIQAATDGSFSRHAQQGGWGWITSGGDFGFGRVTCREPVHAELCALRALLTAIPAAQPVTVHCDSRAAIRLVHDLRPLRGEGPWRDPSARTGHARVALHGIRDLLAQRPGPVQLRWVRGHSGHPLNEGADRLALHARRSQTAGLSAGTAADIARCIAEETRMAWVASA